MDNQTLTEPYNTIAAIICTVLMGAVCLIITYVNLTERIMPKAGDRYRHFKSGNIYRVLTLFIWEPTKEPAILYQSEDTDEQWGRPLSVFMVEVTDPKDPSKQVRRFQPLVDEAAPSELKK